MKNILEGRMTAEIDGEFVVFLIGMKVHRWWKIHRWLPVFLAMPKMLTELYSDPNSGFLGQSGSMGITVQYWRSYEHLESYARNRDKAHWPAWVKFNKVIADSKGDVGIWHETYRVKPGDWECIYSDMPRFGLGRASRVIPISPQYYSSRKRMERSANDAEVRD